MGKGNRTQGGVAIHVKGKNMPVTDALHEQVVSKMGRLDKYLDRLQTIEVELCTEPAREASQRNHVEASAHVPGRTIRVTSDNGDMFSAIDEAVDKLYRQLNRKKERMKDHHAARLVEALPVTETAPLLADELEAEGDEAEESGEPPVVVERLEMKPQFEEEAIEDMLAQGRDFYVFLNARNENVNVVYRRPDGAFGLIQPNAG